MSTQVHPGVTGTLSPDHQNLLGEEALTFITALTRAFRPGLEQLLAERTLRQDRYDHGEQLDFLPETAALRQGDWTLAPMPRDLQDRRVEITGPPERKMLINALNSGAKVYMADFEDSLAPTLENLLGGQANLHHAIRRTLHHEDPLTGKVYTLDAQVATLMVRPRGLHLQERHFTVDGEPVPASLFDAGLFLFHNARELLRRGTGPYLYLPKLEHHLEARWWNQVLEAVEERLALPQGCIRTTMLIETLPAAFQMDEILHEQRNRAVGLNLGRWDYIFSFIKTLRLDARAVLPDRSAITMDQPFLQAYAQLLVRTCHRRGCLALGGMSAFIPQKGDPEGTARAWTQVRADKLREVTAGCDGTWVAHPGLVALAQAEFDTHMPGPNQLRCIPGPVTRAELLLVPQGRTTEQGLRQNLRVGIRYLEAWLRGQGCVALYGLMEDAATAEISRIQVWQWIHHEVEVAGLGRLDRSLFHAFIQETLLQIRAEIGALPFEDGRFLEASDLFETLVLAERPEAFLTPAAYDLLLAPQLTEVM